MMKKYIEKLPGWAYDFFDFESRKPVNRVAYTEQDIQYKIKVMQKMQELGMHLTYDTIGNICGALPAHGKARGNIALPFHSDSVPDGGQYDGTVGGIASLVAIESLKKMGATLGNNIFVVDCAAEESSRFNYACIGSKFLGGKLSTRILSATDKDNIKFDEALSKSERLLQYHMKQAGIRARKVESVVSREQCDISIELHIEQYESLKESGNQIGVVTAIPSSYRLAVSLKGQAGHSGATPMHDRKDAMRAQTEFASRLYRVADVNKNIIVTIPGVETGPISMNKIQDDVRFPVDIRLHYPVACAEIAKQIQDIVFQVEKMTGVQFDAKLLNSSEPVKMDSEYAEKLHRLSTGLGFKTTMMRGIASHDSSFFPARKKGLLHIPSTGGSHNPDEHTSPEDILNGTNVLQRAILDSDSHIR